MNSGRFRLQRKFLPEDFKITDPESLSPYFEDLLNRSFSTSGEAFRWLDDRSELGAVLEEEMAWRYIRMNCQTDNKGYTEAFHYFVREIEPRVTRWSDQLDEKWLQSGFANHDHPTALNILNKKVKNRHELFREENVPIQAELQVKEQIYGKVVSGMTVRIGGKELTLQQAGNYLKHPDREIRKSTFEKIAGRRLMEKDQLDENLSQLITLRTEMAQNAGYENYRDFRHQELGRFDYSVEDCLQFQESIRSAVVPLVHEMMERRRVTMNLTRLYPYDLEVDPEGRPPLKPFTGIETLTNKAIRAFGNIDPRFGELIEQMKVSGYLDLESRKNKAPGGFNYPLYESNIPFIFMNATGNLRDLETLFHEGGHAIHSWLSSKIRWLENKDLPAEIAELASMSMELISMDYWGYWFQNEEDMRRAKREQLEGIIKILPWIASIDRFQHHLYTTPRHSVQERTGIWAGIMNDYYPGLVSWEGFEAYRNSFWQTQLHIFEVPFYYIEYGFAQLGAVAVWRNYRNDPQKTISQYRKALSLGYTCPVPEVYQAAGIRFDFSHEYLMSLMDFVHSELKALGD